MLKNLLFSFAALVTVPVFAQAKPEVPLMRKIFHENIDKAQKSIDKLDKKEDKQFAVGKNEEVNLQVTYTLFNKVDNLQNAIESEGQLDANAKIKYLRGIHEVLQSFSGGYHNRALKGEDLTELLSAYETAMDLERKRESIFPVIEQSDMEVGEILVRLFPFQKNPGVALSRDLLILKACQKRPDRILPILRSNPDISFADSLIKIVARTQQEDLYTYAQSTNTALGRRIQKVDDPLVQMISKLANMKTGRLYFPFLDNLYKEKVSIEDISKVMEDEYKYYRLLVNTQIDYADRLRKRDTPMVMQTLTAMLKKKAIDNFITVINGLHDSPDHIRMKKVEPLNAQELYYICVMGETEIYTSSYLKTYDRIFQRMKNPSSDSLLMSVNFDHFKKFIKMSAGYNTLDNFLKRMKKDNAEILMRAFAKGLEKTGNLEDAVDVADSYASISDSALRKLIRNEVQLNLADVKSAGNRNGIIIYDLLNTLFESMDTNKEDLSAKFGIPGVYSVNNNDLKNAAGRIIIQQFFYGDKDGKGVFGNFIGAFKNANWKIVDKPEWIEVSSTKGVPITIYANRPLDETAGLDAKAQQSLGTYLENNELNPTVVIHRGHSYYVGSTIDQLASSAKIVLLGSCGGYHNIHKVLNIAPYAHIIASKQVGTGTVNQRLIISITDILRQGKDLNWPAMWRGYEKIFEHNPLFEDYVPPHKNLGAIFIMGYKKVFGNQEDSYQAAL